VDLIIVLLLASGRKNYCPDGVKDGRIKNGVIPKVRSSGKQGFERGIRLETIDSMSPGGRIKALGKRQCGGKGSDRKKVSPLKLMENVFLASSDLKIGEGSSGTRGRGPVLNREPERKDLLNQRV